MGIVLPALLCFFPSLISPAFEHGLSIAFDFAIIACLVAAVASLLRGGKYIHHEQAAAQRQTTAAEARPAMSPAEGEAPRAASPRPLQQAPDCPASERADPAAAARVPERLDVVVQRLAHSGLSGPRSRRATPGRFTALAILQASGPLRVGDLAGQAAVAPPTMSRLVDEIIRRGWAQRRVDQTDHRASTISITEAGQAILDAVRHDRTARLAAGLALLEPEETAALLAALSALESLADRIAAAPPRTAQSA
jgi:DNA-binding MarR family transcriptional regulator